MTIMEIYRQYGDVKVTTQKNPTVIVGTILGVDNYFGFDRVIVKWEDSFTESVPSDGYSVLTESFDPTFKNSKFSLK